LNATGAQKFGALTEPTLVECWELFWMDRWYLAPVLRSRITDSGQITGGGAGFSPEEAKDLVLVLKSGALPASMTYLEQSVVGASLGADSIKAGILAAVIALSACFCSCCSITALRDQCDDRHALESRHSFWRDGVFRVDLTLPGIAGVILTIGVGIDSNVLIFERIREELRAGKTAVSSVATSFRRVFVTLIDTHLAALISATFLFLFGTSAIKGFAVTLVIGLVSICLRRFSFREPL
jgi:preprotein translocase subunit SecD